MHSFNLLFVAVFAAAFVSAATDSTSSNYDDYMSQSPPCSRACQKAALETDGCSNIDDFDCHCTNIDVLESILEPCLSQTLHCIEEDITTAMISVCEFSKGTPPTKPEFPSIPSIKPEFPAMPPIKPQVPSIPTSKLETSFLPSFTPGGAIIPSSKPVLIPSPKPELPPTPSSKIDIPSLSSFKSVLSSQSVSSSAPPSSKPSVPSLSPTSSYTPTASPVKPNTPSMPPTKPHQSPESQTDTAASETPCPSIIDGLPCPIHSTIHTAPTGTPVSVITKTIVVPSSKSMIPQVSETPKANTVEGKPAPKPTSVDDDSACEPPRTTVFVTATRPPNVSGTPGMKGYDAEDEEASAAAPVVAFFSLALPVAAFVGLLQVI